MLEASGTSLQMLAITNSSPVKARGVCVGKPAPHVEIKICVDGSSNVGRILTRGPHVMLRYWDQIPEKASNSVEEAWLDTGDIGFIDDHGNLWLVGRTNGRIKSGGENIYPEEVSKHQYRFLSFTDQSLIHLFDRIGRGSANATSWGFFLRCCRNSRSSSNRVGCCLYSIKREVAVV